MICFLDMIVILVTVSDNCGRSRDGPVWAPELGLKIRRLLSGKQMKEKHSLEQRRVGQKGWLREVSAIPSTYHQRTLGTCGTCWNVLQCIEICIWRRSRISSSNEPRYTAFGQVYGELNAFGSRWFGI